jgi:hypothetical protein
METLSAANLKASVNDVLEKESCASQARIQTIVCHLRCSCFTSICHLEQMPSERRRANHEQVRPPNDDRLRRSGVTEIARRRGPRTTPAPRSGASSRLSRR